MTNNGSTLIVGCGYLGQRVARQLRARGERVIGTVRSEARAGELSRDFPGIVPMIADVLDPRSIDRLPAADRALYCVGYDRASGASMRSVYVTGFRDALERLAGRVGRLVLASSTGVYGPSPDAGEWVDEDTPTDPAHESGRVVLAAEEVLRDEAGKRGLAWIILRYAGLYGPGRVPRRASIERNEPIVGDPDRPLNLIHVEDAASAAVAALDRGRSGRIYCVSDDHPGPRGAFYRLAADLLGSPRPGSSSPSPEAPRRFARCRASGSATPGCGKSWA